MFCMLCEHALAVYFSRINFALIECIVMSPAFLTDKYCKIKNMSHERPNEMFFSTYIFLSLKPSNYSKAGMRQSISCNRTVRVS